VITCPGNVTVTTAMLSDPPSTGTPTVTDNCDPNPVVTYDDNRAGLTGCNATGTIVRTWTATDAAGNTATCMQTITITDTVPPVLSPCPSDITVDGGATCSAMVTYPDPTGYDVRHFEGFENPSWTSGSYVTQPSVDWNDDNSHMARVLSGTNGIPSKTGAAHADIDSTSPPAGQTGVFSRLGGYSTVFGTGFKTSQDVYMNLNDPAVLANTYGWDLSTAASGTDGNHRRDFIFHTASNATGTIDVAADNNSNFTRVTNLPTYPNHATITSSGWYTFEWNFRNVGGVLAVEMIMRDAGGAQLFSETRSDPSDLIPTVVGGNRYMWFTFLEVAHLAIDNTSLIRNTVVACTPPSGSTFSNAGSHTVVLHVTVCEPAFENVEPLGGVHATTVLRIRLVLSTANRCVARNVNHM